MCLFCPSPHCSLLPKYANKETKELDDEHERKSIECVDICGEKLQHKGKKELRVCKRRTDHFLGSNSRFPDLPSGRRLRVRDALHVTLFARCGLRVLLLYFIHKC